MTLWNLLGSIDNNLLIALSGILGAVSVRLLDKLLASKRERFDEAERLRNDLRAEIDLLRSERDSAKVEADKWRKEYFAEVDADSTREDALKRLEEEFNFIKYKLRSQGIDLDSQEYQLPDTPDPTDI